MPFACRLDVALFRHAAGLTVAHDRQAAPPRIPDRPPPGAVPLIPECPDCGGIGLHASWCRADTTEPHPAPAPPPRHEEEAPEGLFRGVRRVVWR